MTPATCIMYALSVVVLCAVASRLAVVPSSGRSLRCRLAWNLWVIGQVSIALGALSVLANWAALALPFTFTGLALQYGVRLNRRGLCR